MDKRLIVRNGSLIGFGNVITFASFQGDGKCDSRGQWLNRCIIRTNNLMERCLGNSFGMPSIPQAFPN
jgi:hypothetical protein